MIFDEKNIVYRAQRGDADAFSLLVEAYQGNVYRICLRSGLPPTDAEDASQEAFVKAWQALPGFRGDCQFSTWLYRLAANAAIDVARRQKRHGDTEDIDELPLTDEDSSPQQELEKREAVESVRRALTAVKEEYRTALLLRYMQELSYEEIGKALGVPPGTVKSRINRGKTQLREILLEQGNLFGLESVILAGKEDQP